MKPPFKIGDTVICISEICTYHARTPLRKGKLYEVIAYDSHDHTLKVQGQPTQWWMAKRFRLHNQTKRGNVICK